MKTKPIPPMSVLKKVLTYNRRTGIFHWLIKKRAGKVAGTVASNGYIHIAIAGKKYLAHRLAWVFIKGRISTRIEIDHQNRRHGDNWETNLRTATSFQNKSNAHRRRASGGLRGAVWSSKDRLYKPRIRINGRRISLGCYKTAREANAAYERAARKAHGKFYCK